MSGSFNFYSDAQKNNKIDIGLGMTGIGGTSVIEIISICLAIGFFGNSLLHLLLIFGFPLGEYVLGGNHSILPLKMKFLSGSFLISWLLVGVSYLSYGGIIKIGWLSELDRRIISITTIFLFGAIFSNAFFSNSKKEQKLMLPFCSISCCLSFLLLFFTG